MRFRFIALILALALLFNAACSRLNAPWKKVYRPHEDNLAAREWFTDARFGLMIHWGPFAIKGGGAEFMDEAKLSAAQYRDLASQFNPAKFDPEQWVGLAKFSGARYMTFTAKNADGFAMFDSQHTDFDIMDASPFKRDVVAELAKECDRQGLRLFLGYSQLDWHHPDYFPLGRSGASTGRPSKGNWNQYLDFQNAQLQELVSRDHELAGVWLDGLSDKPSASWKLNKTYDMIHNARPDCLIGNNHHDAPNDGEDFIIFDRIPPGATGYADLPLELAEPMGEVWGWSPADVDNYRSTREILHSMIRASGSNSNYLLGITPDDSGAIPQQQIQRLREIGNWLEIYGPSIFGTRGGPLPPAEWGVTTHQDRKVYIHYITDKGGSLRFSSRIGEIDVAYQFSTGLSMNFTKDGDEYVFEIPERILDPVDTIIVLEMEPPKSDEKEASR